MGKSTISMAIFNSYVKLPEGIYRTTRSNMTLPFFGSAFQWSICWMLGPVCKKCREHMRTWKDSDSLSLLRDQASGTCPSITGPPVKGFKRHCVVLIQGQGIPCGGCASELLVKTWWCRRCRYHWWTSCCTCLGPDGMCKILYQLSFSSEHCSLHAGTVVHVWTYHNVSILVAGQDLAKTNTFLKPEMIVRQLLRLHFLRESSGIVDPCPSPNVAARCAYGRNRNCQTRGGRCKIWGQHTPGTLWRIGEVHEALKISSLTQFDIVFMSPKIIWHQEKRHELECSKQLQWCAGEAGPADLWCGTTCQHEPQLLRISLEGLLVDCLVVCWSHGWHTMASWDEVGHQSIGHQPHWQIQLWSWGIWLQNRGGRCQDGLWSDSQMYSRNNFCWCCSACCIVLWYHGWSWVSWVSWASYH